MSDVFQSLLGRGDVCFGAEDVAKLVAGFESALAKLGLNDPTTCDIARLIVQIAKDGQRDPAAPAADAPRMRGGRHGGCRGCQGRARK
jgi:hypothetical protein